MAPFEVINLVEHVVSSVIFELVDVITICLHGISL